MGLVKDEGTAETSLAAEQNGCGVVPQWSTHTKEVIQTLAPLCFQSAGQKAGAEGLQHPPFSAFTFYSELYFPFLPPNLCYCS